MTDSISANSKFQFNPDPQDTSKKSIKKLSATQRASIITQKIDQIRNYIDEIKTFLQQPQDSVEITSENNENGNKDSKVQEVHAVLDKKTKRLARKIQGLSDHQEIESDIENLEKEILTIKAMLERLSFANNTTDDVDLAILEFHKGECIFRIEGDIQHIFRYVDERLKSANHSKKMIDQEEQKILVKQIERVIVKPFRELKKLQRDIDEVKNDQELNIIISNLDDKRHIQYEAALQSVDKLFKMYRLSEES